MDTLVINAGGGSEEEHEANAHLIAAAPELLAALEECIRDYDEKRALFSGFTPGHIRVARDAVAKARGKGPQ